MTCEIDIDTSRVWQAGEYLLVGRRANFDALWNDINRLDSALNSLRSFNNSSGSVVAHVERSQQYLNKCKSHCIEPTTNAMVRTGNFLQDVAIEYEASERYVKSLWDDNYTHRSWSASSKVHSFSNAVSVKNNPVKYLTSKYSSTKKVSKKINKVYGKFSSVKSSGGAISGACDFSTKTEEEKTEYKNPLSDVWHRCFG